jgi:hypothetical protein
MDQVTAALTETRNEVQRQRAQLQTITAQLQAQQAELTLLRSQIPTRASRPKASLPDPEKFTGQSFKFDT